MNTRELNVDGFGSLCVSVESVIDFRGEPSFLIFEMVRSQTSKQRIIGTIYCYINMNNKMMDISDFFKGISLAESQ